MLKTLKKLNTEEVNLIIITFIEGIKAKDKCLLQKKNFINTDRPVSNLRAY